mmetsp:Transcript_3299/g.7221  ORF Transcript_3299/g.7221 Transcript_3299/m.7221 type:complete len:164 (-) Transcript_3299:465-956(-)
MTQAEPQQQTSSSNSNLSALQDNIQRNGGQSYYYAHKPRNTGEAPAPPPVHTVLEKQVVELPENVETIFQYQFLDDDAKVKVYIPLEGVGAAIQDSSITAQFGDKSLEVSVRDYKPGRVLRLTVKELCGEIVAEQCSFKKMAHKVVVTLSKKDSSSKWSKLAA